MKERFKNLNEITLFNITLRRISDDDLPLLHKWRNDESVLPFMEDARAMPENALLFWLNKVKNRDDIVNFIASIDNEDFGYFELKHIDRKNSTCESGMFMFGDKFIGAGLGVYIALIREVVMQRLNIETLISKMNKNNHKNLKMAKHYDFTFSHYDGDFLVYITDKEVRLNRMYELAKRLNLDNQLFLYLNEN